jgi:hypothetical protein
MVGRKPKWTHRPGPWVALFFVACVVAGCALAQKRKASLRPGLQFPHKVHIAGEGFECHDCHATAGQEAAAGMPRFEGCFLCHEDIDPQKPADRRITAMVENGEPKWQRRAVLGGDLTFSHAVHAKAKIGCEPCHGDVAATVAIQADVALSMDDCMGCHLERRLGRECSICHEKVRSDVLPATHGPAWTKLHGEVVRTGRTDQTRHQCTLCHMESSCDSCHLAETPADHTALWRWQGHAIGAAFDRERCTTCHQADSCIECHEITEPRSHTPAWASPPGYLHCSEGCHVDASGAGCTICHRNPQPHAGTPPPSSATSPHPMPMGGGYVCLSCHGT